VGGVAFWLWGEELRRRASDGSRAARFTAVDTLKAMEDKADEMLDAAKGQVHSALQAGQEAVRPKIA